MKVPREVFSVFGPVPVVEVPGLFTSKNQYGEWEYQDRRILVDADTTDTNKMHTLFHECVHVALTDSGLNNFLSTKQTEGVADAVGLWLAAAVRAGYLKLSVPR